MGNLVNELELEVESARDLNKRIIHSMTTLGFNDYVKNQDIFKKIKYDLERLLTQVKSGTFLEAEVSAIGFVKQRHTDSSDIEKYHNQDMIYRIVADICQDSDSIKAELLESDGLARGVRIKLY